MKLFLDTADIEEIRTVNAWGVLDGVTTNPTLFGMVKEGRHFAKLADNVYVKVPMSENGLEAIARFKAEGIRTNCTLIFSANQGLLAAKAGASLLSPFVGRLDDINEEGMTVIRELVEIVTTTSWRPRS